VICCLIAYDASGAILATLEHMVATDDQGRVIGLIDFAAHEDAGGEHTDIWRVESTVRKAQPDDLSVLSDTPLPPIGTTTPAKGSKVWPEWLGSAAHDFHVELEGPPGRKRIAALVHTTSGHRRERAAVEAAIAAVPVHEWTGARDIRHIVGGPDRPLHLDEHGRTISPDHAAARKGTPAHLPLIGGRSR
jgi:hypothetical protein